MAMSMKERKCPYFTKNMKIHKSSVSPILVSILSEIMTSPLFDCFRLVGGTNLALRFDHRISTDIDLFTDAEYGSLDFKVFENWLRSRYPYVECNDKSTTVVMGRTYYVGNSEEDAVKLDLMYENDKFLFPIEQLEGLRIASVQEIAVMKLDAIFYGGRKKDFWDLHFLLFDIGLNLEELIELHRHRFEYTHDREEMLNRLTDFTKADGEPDPLCKHKKSWDSIKLDLIDEVETIN